MLIQTQSKISKINWPVCRSTRSCRSTKSEEPDWLRDVTAPCSKRSERRKLTNSNIYQFLHVFRNERALMARDSVHFSEGWSQDIFSRCQEIRRVYSGHLCIYTNTSIYNYTAWSNNEQNLLLRAVRRAFAYWGNVWTTNCFVRQKKLIRFFSNVKK